MSPQYEIHVPYNLLPGLVLIVVLVFGAKTLCKTSMRELLMQVNLCEHFCLISMFIIFQGINQENSTEYLKYISL